MSDQAKENSINSANAAQVPDQTGHFKVCPRCGLTTADMELFESHNQIHGSSKKSFIAWPNEQQGSYCCPHPKCTVMLYYKSHMENHIKFHDKTKLQCIYLGCKYEFHDLQSFREHAEPLKHLDIYGVQESFGDEVNSPHSSSTTSASSPDVEYRCTVCEEIIIGKQHFTQHKKNHAELVLACPCGKRYLTKPSYKKHLQDCGVGKMLNTIVNSPISPSQAILPDKPSSSNIQKDPQAGPSSGAGTPSSSSSGKRTGQIRFTKDEPTPKRAIIEVVQAPVQAMPTARTYICPIDTISFVSREGLDFHMLLHTNPMLFSSDIQPMIQHVTIFGGRNFSANAIPKNPQNP